MDHEISIQCRIYKLEETCIQPGKTPDNFSSDEEKEWNLQYWLVWALNGRVSEETACPLNQGDNSKNVGGLQHPPHNQRWDGTWKHQACPYHSPRTSIEEPTTNAVHVARQDIGRASADQPRRSSWPPDHVHPSTTEDLGPAEPDSWCRDWQWPPLWQSKGYSPECSRGWDHIGPEWSRGRCGPLYTLMTRRWCNDNWNRSIHTHCDTSWHREMPPHKGKVQGWYQYWQQCYAPAHLHKTVPEEVQQRWISNLTQSIYHSPYCLQWFSDQAVWDLQHPHRLDTKWFKDHQTSPHMMVHCWHTWTSNTWTSCLPQTQNCRAPLCCWPVTDEDNTAEDPYNWMPKNTRWSWDVEDTQLKRGPHQWVPGLLWMNQTIPWYLPHHSLRRCQTSSSCPTQVPHCKATIGEGEVGWVARRRYKHPCRRTNRLGELTDILNQAKWKTAVMLRPQGSQLINQEGSLQHSHSEEITHQLASSTRFMKLDGTSWYLCIVLESLILATFNTPWGQYRFVRLPFRLACSQDIF